jgi:hypothetical protein
MKIFGFSTLYYYNGIISLSRKIADYINIRKAL